MAPDDATPRPVASFDQAGDTSIGQAIGGNVVHGMDPEAALAQTIAFIKEHVWKSDQQREERDKEIARAVRWLGEEFKAYQIMDSRRWGAETKEREERRKLLDDTLDAVAVALDNQAKAITRQAGEIRVLRWIALGLGAGLLVATVVIGWLFLREVAAATAVSLLRYWLGAGAALALALRR